MLAIISCQSLDGVYLALSVESNLNPESSLYVRGVLGPFRSISQT